jgi:cyclomaltodextrinase
MLHARDPLWAALLGATLLVAACTDDRGSAGDGSDTRPTPVAFETIGGDSFEWSEEVRGRTECGPVTLTVNGSSVETGVETIGTKFEAKVPVIPGSNEVVAACEGSGEAASDSITFNQRLSARPTARISVSVDGSVVTFDGRKSSPSEADGAEITGYRWSAGGRRVDEGTQGRLRTARGGRFIEATGRVLELAAPNKDGEYFVSLEVTDAEGRVDTSTTYFVVERGVAREVDVLHEHPVWINDAVLYAPIPALWGNGGPRAVTRKLPYLRKLGVDVLWLWPPTSKRAVGEEYAIVDYFDIDPSWQPESAFKSLVDRAHGLGMHVIVDFVPNHMSAEGPYFTEAQDLGPRSTYWNFFDRREGEPTYYFDWEHLPNLNYDNPEIRVMVTEAMGYWVREMKVDGFRVDVAWGIKRRRPEFWRRWRREMKRIQPDLFLLAEAPAVDPYYFSNGFDIAYDWARDVGRWAWGSSFEFPEESGALLASAVTNGGRGYSQDALVLRFLNNNDTGVRFVDRYGARVTKVAATMQFTLPGIPAMFAGDEIGASYEPYSNLSPIPWRDKRGLRSHYERLIDLRHTLPTLASRDVDILESDWGSVFSYIRPARGGGGPLLVVLNFAGKARPTLSGKGLDKLLAARPPLRDLLSNELMSWSGGGRSITLKVPATSSFVLAPGGKG